MKKRYCRQKNCRLLLGILRGKGCSPINFDEKGVFWVEKRTHRFTADVSSGGGGVCESACNRSHPTPFLLLLLLFTSHFPLTIHSLTLTRHSFEAEFPVFWTALSLSSLSEPRELHGKLAQRSEL